MHRILLQQLTTSELDQHLYEVEHAIESHFAWFSTITRSLLFSTEPPESDLAERPEQLCSFGRWYESVQTPELRNDPTFDEIGEVHRQVHESAKRLLTRVRDGEAIGVAEYDEFVERSNSLRHRSQRLRAALKQNQGLISRLMLKVFENANEGVIITDPRAHILQVNRAFSRVTGYDADEVIGRNPSVLYSGRQPDDFYRQMWRKLTTEGHWEGEIWNRRKNGELYLEWLSIAAVNDEMGNLTHYVGLFSDITRAKDNEERLRRLAHFDQLTELPNRTLFLDRLDHAIAIARRQGKQLAVLFLDLDGFKAVNDSLGHATGDELLRHVGRRLQAALRESDTVSRFGGDEFTIVLPDVPGPKGAAVTAAKLIDAVAEPYFLDGHTIRITMSLGISLFPASADTSEALVAQADLAMYRAKRRGAGRYEFFTPDSEPAPRPLP